MTYAGTAIVGVGETAYTKRSGRSEQSLAAEAAWNAVRDAGIEGADIDGIVPFLYASVSAEDLAAALGCDDLGFVGAVPMGGAATVAGLTLADWALRSGRASYVLLCVARNGNSGRRAADRASMLPGQSIRSQVEHPFGWSTPAQWYAMFAARYMDQYQVSREMLANVAIQARSNAQLNERAMMRGTPLTMEDYLDAPLIASPYHRYDCCLETDGAAAIVITTADRAADLRHKPINLLGSGEGHPPSPDDIASRDPFFEVGLHRAAPRAFQMSGIQASDLDLALIYDCFTFEVLHQLEAMGICQPGEAGDFVASGATKLGGSLPVNPHGGLLSEGHMVGMNHINEAVRQLRGDAGKRQVPGARLAAVTGWGDMGDGSMAVLGS